MPGELSGFTCPECRGPLRELRDDGLLRYRCQTGHGFTAESLLVGESEALEQALYASLNVLKEQVRLTKRLNDEAQKRGHERVATRMEERARETAEHMDVIQRVLLRMRQPAGLYEMATD